MVTTGSLLQFTARAGLRLRTAGWHLRQTSRDGDCSRRSRPSEREKQPDVREYGDHPRGAEDDRHGHARACAEERPSSREPARRHRLQHPDDSVPEDGELISQTGRTRRVRVQRRDVDFESERIDKVEREWPSQRSLPNADTPSNSIVLRFDSETRVRTRFRWRPLELDI